MKTVWSFVNDPLLAGLLLLSVAAACGASPNSNAKTPSGPAQLGDTEAQTDGTKARGSAQDNGGDSADTTALGLAAAIKVVETLMIDDCSDREIANSVGGYWGTFDDRWDGNGESVVWPKSIVDGGVFEMSEKGYENEGFAARMTGTTGSKLGYDYVAIGATLGPNAECPNPQPASIDLSLFDGIRFMAKGSLGDGTLEFVLPHSKDGPENNCTVTNIAPDTATNYSDYFLEIQGQIEQSWSSVTASFAKMKQPSGTSAENRVSMGTVLAHLKEFNILYKNPRGAKVDLWIDNVELYRSEPHTDFDQP